MQILPVIETAIWLATVVVLIAKTVHFYLHVGRRHLIYWFYFNNHSIINSRNEKSRKAKKMQNLFSMILIVLIVTGAIGITLFGF